MPKPTKEQLLHDFPALKDLKSVFGELYITAYISDHCNWRSERDINIDQFVCATPWVEPISWKELKDKYR